MQWTAKVWNFQAQDAVEAVMMKVESRSPLTFSPVTLGKPQVGISLRVIADKLMKHQGGGEITRAIWDATKRARTAQSGSSAYTTEVTGKFGTLYHATEEWQIHYRKREHCELRTRTIAEAIRGTNQEVEELRKEVLRAHGEGLAATRLAVMDEAGDVWYGAQCYVVAYQEQCQRAIATWLGQAKQTMTSVAVEHEDTTARWITVLLRMQRRERSHELERWSKEMRLVRHCSIHLGTDTAKQEANGAVNHAAIRWDTVALRALQQERNQRLRRWSEEVRLRVDGAGRNMLMKDLAARMMAPAAKTCLMNMIIRNMEKELQEKMSDSDD